jgi:hypothetical protein
MTSRPLRLTDAELDAVFAAARPLPTAARDAFLQEVARLLRGCDMVGPGTVHRVCVEAQRQFFDPPTLDETRGVSRWGRNAPGFERVSKRAV